VWVGGWVGVRVHVHMCVWMGGCACACVHAWVDTPPCVEFSWNNIITSREL